MSVLVLSIQVELSELPVVDKPGGVMQTNELSGVGTIDGKVCDFPELRLLSIFVTFVLCICIYIKLSFRTKNEAVENLWLKLNLYITLGS